MIISLPLCNASYIRREHPAREYGQIHLQENVNKCVNKFFMRAYM